MKTFKTGNAFNMHLAFYACLFLNLLVSALTYTIPDPKVQILSPKGLRISIPHENGIVLVGYHININKPIALLQPGDYIGDITNPSNGQWVFEIRNAFIDPGDKINFWVHVQYGSYAFRKLGSEIASGDAVNISEPSSDSEDPPPILTPTSSSETYTRPTSPTTTDDEFTCEPSRTTVDRKIVCKGQLIFEDNFNTLNWTKWKREVRIPLYANDAEFVSFQKRDENCYVSDGQLHIVPNLLSEVPGFTESSIRTGELDLGSDCTGIVDISQECTRHAQFSQILPPVVSARIRTKDFFSFRYGKVEVRAKLPRGDWLFPLILLEPIENYYGFTEYASGQMRVAFIRGNEFLNDRDDNEISGYRIAGGVVLATREALRDVWLKGSLRRTHLGNDFHTYTLTWTDNLISLEIDGNEYAIIRGGFSRLYTTQNLKHAKLWDNGNAMAPFDREFFLTLGVSAGGHSDFPDGVLNGFARLEKPWKNEHPKAELQFWNDRENWLKTWNGENAGLHVDYIRVYAL
ncbi:gram-negative bacteria-binding protein 1-like [Eupeodes corollae]|uniref:gram-negative bacteria-binding protein 1-like n=1 Tax=Eupeodes corollae TaxID=290404 RepID=UPI00249112AC|nr:gram-negative bacteria-binding protein 1-like [Eupeodes corollae]